MDLPASIGRRPLWDGDQFSNLAVGQAETAAGFAQLRSFPTVEFAPLRGMVEELSKYFGPQRDNIRIRYDTNRS
ncbi:MAG: hypothetical protein MUQ27_06695 [Acidimicrobiia bacterium]|nr:hypothetical protein [Acidimicrobiia bacterium]